MKRILILDEDEDFRRELEAIFSRHGYEPVQAESIEIGLKRLDHEKVDLILLGLRSPSAEFLVMLQRGIPTLAMLAPAAGLRREEARALGCAEAFDRPFSGPEILAAAKCALREIPTLQASILAESIGRGGFTGRFAGELSAGAAVIFQLRCGALHLRGEGVVRWAKSEGGELGSCLGVEFVELSAECRDEFAAWMAEHNPLPFIPKAA